MRLWSIHPKYLDVMGLSGLWRESLLAKKVLKGETSKYKNHPQLNRFKYLKDSIPAINTYILHVYRESCARNYCFNKNFVEKPLRKHKITITQGQIDYEFSHLKNKLKVRAKKKYVELLKVKKILPHPLFKIVKGPIADWERC